MADALSNSDTPLRREAELPPRYGRVLLSFLRNGLVREMTFRTNFLMETITNAFWFTAQVIMFDLIYGKVTAVGGWSRYEYFAFMATGMLVNTLIEAFFMPNCENFSELIRTGNLDFALLKPIDTQFLISFEKFDLAALSNLLLALTLLGYALLHLGRPLGVLQVAHFLAMIGLGVTFFYSLMIILASTSVWLGRNQGLYEFWFYITSFARYPRSIYSGSLAGDVLRLLFSYVLPILLVVTVPAEVVIGRALHPSWISLVAAAGAAAGMAGSRVVFQRSLKSYRSASS